MLTERSIVTLNDVKDFLGINRTNTSKDDMLENWIDWVSGKFESEIDNVVHVQDKTVYLDGSGESYQYLPFYPIVAIVGDTDAAKLTNVQCRDNAEADWEDLVDSISLVHISDTDTDRLELLDGNTFPEGDRNIRIRYWAGHDTIPGDITLVVMKAVQMLWNESAQGGDRLGVTSSSSTTGVGSTSEGFTDRTPEWREVVRRYVKPVHNIELYR